jgi:tetratricopeptide (TPR) repeat protein
MNKKRINAIDTLFDEARFVDDKNAKHRFRKTLGLLVRAEKIKCRVFKSAAIKFMKIAKDTEDSLDKAYCMSWAGRCYEDYGDNRLAATCYAAAVGLAPSDVFSAERLGDYFWEADFEESAQHYNQVLEYNPTCSRTYYKLGKLHGNNGDSAVAISQYEKAVEVHNGYIAPMAEAAIECAKKGDRENSVRWYLLAMANDLYEFEKLEESVNSCLGG